MRCFLFLFAIICSCNIPESKYEEAQHKQNYLDENGDPTPSYKDPDSVGLHYPDIDKKYNYPPDKDFY